MLLLLWRDFQRDSQAEWKHKRVIIGFSSHPQSQKVKVARRVSYHSPGGQSSRQSQQTHQAPPTQYRAPTQQVQQPQGQQVLPRQGQGNEPGAYFKCGKEGHYAHECLKALVWFWLIDETLSANLVYQDDYEICSMTPSDEAMVKIMTMVMAW